MGAKEDNPLHSPDELSVDKRIEKDNSLTFVEAKRGFVPYTFVGLSAAASLYGWRTVADPFTDDMMYIYIFLGVMGVIILGFEYARAIFLAKELTYRIERLVNPHAKRSRVGIGFVYIVTIAFILFNVFGSISIMNYFNTTGIDNKAKNTTAFKLAQTEAKSGSKELKKWQSDEADMIRRCDYLHKGRKWRTKNQECRDAWYGIHPNPADANSTNSADVSLADYSKIHTAVKNQLEGVGWMILVAALLLFTGLEFLAIFPIYNQYTDKMAEMSGEKLEKFQLRFKNFYEAQLKKIDRASEIMKIAVAKANELELERQAIKYEHILADMHNDVEKQRALIPVRDDNGKRSSLIQKSSDIGYRPTASTPNLFKATDENYTSPEPLQEGRAESTVTHSEPSEAKAVMGFRDKEETNPKKTEGKYNINFTTDDLIKAIKISYQDGAIGVGEFVASKDDILKKMPTTISGDLLNSRHVTNYIKAELKKRGAVKYVPGFGDRALKSMEEVLNEL